MRNLHDCNALRVSEVMPCLPKCLGVACLLLTALPGYAQIGTPERPKPASIEVLVTDPDDRPIPEAEVSWSSAAATSRRVRVIPEALRTDLNGKCVIELHYEGAFRVAIRREGYLDAGDLSRFEHVEIVDVAMSRTVKLFVDLVRSASLQGTVYLDDGRRLAGADVRLQAATLTWTGTVESAAPEWLKAKTDAQGNYAFPVVPPARYGMWISPPDSVVRASLQQNDRHEWTGYATAIWHSSVEELRRIVPVEISPGEDVRGYNVVLRKTRVYPFYGRLKPWNGEPPLHVKVALRVGSSETINLLEPRPVSASGEFDFPALPEGHYSLLVYRDEAPESPPYSIPLDINPLLVEAVPTGKSGGLRREFSVPPWVPVAGKVAMIRHDPTVVEKTPDAPVAGQPAPRRTLGWWEAGEVQVRLAPVQNNVPVRADTLTLRSLETADGRSMSFPDTLLAPGEYQFQVQAPEPWYVATAKSGDVDLLEQRAFPLAGQRYDRPVRFVVELRQGGTALEGLIVNEKGEPLSHSAVCAMAESPARRAQPGGAFCVRADSDGAFRSRWLSPGDWKVWALTKRPRENPAGRAFQEKYDRQARKLTVPEDGGTGRRTLVAVE